jgi:hypothetical protein
VLGRQQHRLDTEPGKPAGPVVGRAAGFHHDQAHRAVGKEAFELPPCEPMRAHDAPVLIGFGQLEDRLCKIDGHGSSIHVGLLSFEDLIPTPMKTSAQLSREKRGESIPSANTDAQARALAKLACLVRAGYLQRPGGSVTFSGVLAVVAASLSGIALAQQPPTVETFRGHVFGVGEGFGAAVAARVRKLPSSGTVSRQELVVFNGVRVTVLRTSTQVIPLQVEAPSPEAVRVVNKTLSEMPRSGLVPNFGVPQSESDDVVTYRGPAEICEELLELKFSDNALVSAKWTFCIDQHAT